MASKFISLAGSLVLLSYELSPAAPYDLNSQARIVDDRIELVPDGDFEELARGSEKVFGISGSIQVMEDVASAYRGRKFLRWRGPENSNFSDLTIDWPPNEIYVSSPGRSWEPINGIRVFRGLDYKLQLWARGSGTLEPWIIRYNRRSFVVGGLAQGRYKLTPQWQRIHIPYKLTPSNLATEVSLYFRLQGDKDSVAYLDDVSFSCPAIKEAVANYFPPYPRFRGGFDAPEAKGMKLYRNGVPLSDDPGKFQYELRPAQNDIVLEVNCSKGRPVKIDGGFAVSGQDFSLADGSWLWTTNSAAAFNAGTFDEKQWKKLKADNDGASLPAFEQEQIVFIRRSVYVPHQLDRFIFPKQPAFHIAHNSVTLKTLMLVRMNPEDKGKVIVEVEVPEEIRILPKEGGENIWCNIIPEKMEETFIERGGIKYRRYEIHAGRYNNKEELKGGWLTLQPQIPLYLTLERMPADKRQRSLRIRRIERGGNATESWYIEPVVFLPEPVGGKPKKFMIYYRAGAMWNPWYYPNFRVSKEERYTGIQALCAISPSAHRVESEEWRKELDRLESSYTVPNFGAGEYADHHSWAFFFEDHPECRFVPYRGRGFVTYANPHGMCYTHLLSPTGEEAFRRYEAKLARGVKGAPGARFIHEETATYFSGDACFCDLCKNEFAKSLGRPELAKLSDTEIISKHAKEYGKFVVSQIGRFRVRKRQILNKYGVHYFLHDEGTMPFGGHQAFFGKYAEMGVSDTMDANANAYPWWASATAGLGPLAGEPSVQRFIDAVRRSVVGKTSIGGAINNPYGEYPQRFRNIVLRGAAGGRSGVMKFETNTAQYATGSFYYIADATRTIEEIEPFLISGERRDYEFKTDDPDKELLAFKVKEKTMVLVFNDDFKPSACRLQHAGGAKLTGSVWNSKTRFKDKSEIRFTIGDNNAAVVYVTLNGGKAVSRPEIGLSWVQHPEEHFSPWRFLRADDPNCEKPVSELIGQLKSKSEVERTSGAKALHLLGEASRPAIPALAMALSDKSPQVRSHALQALRRFGPEAASPIPSLKEAYTKGTKDEKITVLRIFETMGPSAVPAMDVILSAMSEKDWDIHRQGFATVKELGPEAAKLIPDMLEIVQKTNDSDLYRMAPVAFGRFGPAAKDALPALRKALRKEKPFFKKLKEDHVIWAMGNIGGLTDEDIQMLRKRQKGGNVYADIALRKLKK